MRVTILLVLPSCGLLGDQERCDMRGVAAELAGPGAADCGAIEQGAAEAEAWACAVDALEAGEPFYLTWDRSGSDSLLHEGLTSDGGRVVRLHQDDYFGPGISGIDGWICVDPVAATASGTEPETEPVECGSLEPEGNHYQVCGRICGPDQCQPQPLPFPS